MSRWLEMKKRQQRSWALRRYNSKFFSSGGTDKKGAIWKNFIGGKRSINNPRAGGLPPDMGMRFDVPITKGVSPKTIEALVRAKEMQEQRELGFFEKMSIYNRIYLTGDKEVDVTWLYFHATEFYIVREFVQLGKFRRSVRYSDRSFALAAHQLRSVKWEETYTRPSL